MTKSILIPIIVLTVLINCFIQAESRDCCGKVDVGLAYVHLDVLESGHTVKRIDKIAFKGDAHLRVYKGIVLKPTVLFSDDIFAGGIAIGHCTPVHRYLTLTPNIGVSASHITTRIDIPFYGFENLSENFRSRSFFVGLDYTINISSCWRICGIYQYVWSRTYTRIEGLLNSKGHSKGSNYGLMLETDINDYWSVNIGGAYNISLSKEKHGIRGAGAKIGIVYWLY